jgi:DNA helicase II / ATP-dependent DNA helicase PcrA
VITCRIAFLLRERRVPAEQILAVTFTNKAAREMKERVEELVGRKSARGMGISTFHSLCVRILKEDIERLGYKKNFSIYGAADQARLVRDLIQSHDTHGRKFDADRVLWLISDAKNRLVPPEQFTVRHQDEYEYLAAEIYPRYQKSLKAFNAIDFDDIIMLTVRLFREHQDVLAKYQVRFRYLMVDEYQDTNAAQYLLLRFLAEQHRNLCVVGDDDQSIYGWRGADLGNILGFERDFPGTKVIKLEQNYRSTGNILAAANAVIKNNRQRKEKALWTADDRRGADRLPALRRRGGRGAPGGRAHPRRPLPGESRLPRFRHPLPHQRPVAGLRGAAALREHPLRADRRTAVLRPQGGQGHRRLLQGSGQPRDEVNLLRILNFPRRGIGETTADRLIRASAEQGRSALGGAADAGRRRGTGGEGAGRHCRVRRADDGIPRAFPAQPAPGRDWGGSSGDAGIEDELYRTADDPAKAKRRVDNVAEVLNALASYEEREAEPTLAGFLEKVSLLDRDDPGRGSKEEKLARDAVILMSLHSSKGLEFPHVFLVGMEEEYLPHKKSVGEMVDVDEERRLCYVGITRARRSLTLLGAARRKKYGKMIPREPSRFLQEVPGELLQKSTGEAKPAASAAEQEQSAGNFFAGIKALLGD